MSLNDTGIISAEAMSRHTFGAFIRNNEDEWFHAHQAYLSRISDYFVGFDVHPVIYFRDRESFITSLFKESVANAGPALRFTLEEFVEDRRHRLDYERYQTLLECTFGSATVRSYESAREVGLLNDFASVVGIPEHAMTSTAPNNNVVRRSLCNTALRWIQMAHRNSGPSSHIRRLQFALRHHGSGPFAEDGKSTLWQSDEARQAFLQTYGDTEDAAQPGIQSPKPVIWTTEMQRDTDALFLAWEAENIDMLKRRERLRLRFHQPDPT